jgi:hypothetical protein
MKTKNIFALTLGISLLSIMLSPSMASANLIGDEVTVTLEGTFDTESPQTNTVGAGVEFPFPNTGTCGSPDESFEVDIDSSSIWVNIAEFTGSFLYCDDQGLDVGAPLTLTFTDLDWVNDPSGIVTGINVVGVPPVPVNAIVNDEHSVTVTIDASGYFESFTVHFDLITDHSTVVGGEGLPIDSTALLMAGMSSNLSLIIPIAAGIAGAGAIFIRSRINKD